MVLTKAQVAAIQKNWTSVSTDNQGFGNKLFLRYLEVNPGDMHFFPKFGKTAYSKLVYDGEFNKQTCTVMEFLGQVVANLGSMDKAGDMLKERVRTHKPREITMAQFERLLDLLPRFLEEEASATGGTADAWRVAVATLMPYMRTEFGK